MVQSKVNEDPDVSVESLIEVIRSKIFLKVPYYKAARARKKALSNTYGDFDSSYQYLESYLNKYAEQNPGSIVDLTKNGDRFFRCFFAPIQALNAAKLSLPIIFLDATFGKTSSKGMMLLATCIDGLLKTQFVAIGFVENESGRSWGYFLQKLKAALPEFNREDFTFVSDRDKGLDTALADSFPRAKHAICLRHLTANVETRFKKGRYSQMIWELAKADNEDSFNSILDNIREQNVAVAQYLERSGFQNWALLKFQGSRFGHLTSNIAESSNNSIMKERNLPITTALKSFVEKIAKRFEDRVQKVRGREEISSQVEAIISVNSENIGNATVTRYGPSKYVVTQHRKDFIVDLQYRSCTCLLFQDLLIPCKHAMAVLGRYFSVDNAKNLLHSAYLVENVKTAFNQTFQPIILTQLTRDNLLPPVVHRRRGAPKISRQQGIQDFVRSVSQRSSPNGSQVEQPERAPKRSHKCSICMMEGHNKRSCANRERTQN